MRAGAAWLLAALVAGPAAGQGIEAAPHDALAPLLDGRIDFEELPALPEPGHNLNHGLAVIGARLGERFAGQRLAEAPGPEDGRHDAPEGRPDAPLALETGAPGRGLSVSFHRAFGSNALYPLGPVGWPAEDGRGEGSAAVLFTRDACAVTLRLHTEYVDALGTNTAHRGDVSFAFYGRDGRLMARLARRPGGGISGFGFRTETGAPAIAGLLVTNLDPGGIALDDIRFGCLPLTG
ncbi:hypothetical protein Ga0609869_000357 [Rhodovulum iodosum]|uniref:Uncharacterized protein n=1 Tax=Rhodovulum iodosum TaxID=68291 RepID=A0ABV3XNV9_9RHOB|nr:hypothetical protein [Rhodovulum robiginosum]RSK37945.1 hypothetical protein EJA01_03200 [Rhodovulum robiginosum]